jgi:hypothetical protein
MMPSGRCAEEVEAQGDPRAVRVLPDISMASAARRNGGAGPFLSRRQDSTPLSKPWPAWSNVTPEVALISISLATWAGLRRLYGGATTSVGSPERELC